MKPELRAVLAKAAPVIIGLSIIGFILGLPGNLAVLFLAIGIAMFLFLPKKEEQA